MAIKVWGIQRKSPVDQSVGYYLSTVLYSRITRDDILDAAVRNSQVPKAYLSLIYDALITELKNLVMNGHSFTLRGLGNFTATIRSKGVVDAAAFDVSKVKMVKFVYRPDVKIKRLVTNAKIVYIGPKPVENDGI